MSQNIFKLHQHFFLKRFIYLFSAVLGLSVVYVGAALCCGAWASHCGRFCCRVLALKHGLNSYGTWA